MHLIMGIIQIWNTFQLNLEIGIFLSLTLFFILNNAYKLNLSTVFINTPQISIL